MAQSPRKRGPKTPDEPHDPVVTRMLTVGEWNSARQMCRELGLATRTLTRRTGEGKGVSPIWVKLIAAMTGAREEYLWTGHEPVYESDRLVSSYGRGADIALHRYQQLTKAQRQLWVHVADLMSYLETDLQRLCARQQALLDAKIGWRNLAAHPGSSEEDYHIPDEADGCRDG